MIQALQHKTTPHRRRIAAGLVAALAVLAAPMAARAEGAAPRLELPIDCVPGQSCWISKFVDLDPGPGVRDYMCYGRANDKHSGIDIAVRDLRAMDEGVSVLAAAPGTVLRTRDGVQDISARDVSPEMISRGECGNGVIVDHGDGWSTQYCHMHQGSIAVKPGDHVVTGQKLGLVGMSGSSEYPHLHLTVRHDNEIVDAFVGLEDRSPPTAKCGLGAAPLWSDKALAELAFTPAAIANVGFAAVEPKRPDVPLKEAGLNFSEDDVRKGRYRSTDFPDTAPVLVFWGEIFGVEAGDVLHWRLVAPNGKVAIDHQSQIAKRQARHFEYVAVRRPRPGWPEGTYRGEITVTRTGNGKTLTSERAVEAHIGGFPAEPSGK